MGRFTTCDPLFEKYYGWSPYVYSANNPVSFKDDNGMFKIPNSSHIDDHSGKKAGNYNIKYPLMATLLKFMPQMLIRKFAGNKTCIDVLTENTKLKAQQIMNDFTYGKGPELFAVSTTNYGWNYGLNSPPIIRDAELIQAERALTKGDYVEANVNLFISAMTIIHEYLHSKGYEHNIIEKIERILFGNINMKSDTDRRKFINGNENMMNTEDDDMPLPRVQINEVR